MPCYCDADDSELIEAQVQCKKKAKEIVSIIKDVSHPTDTYPELLRDTIKLLEHLYTGKCDERGI